MCETSDGQALTTVLNDQHWCSCYTLHQEVYNHTPHFIPLHMAGAGVVNFVIMDTLLLVIFMG